MFSDPAKSAAVRWRARLRLIAHGGTEGVSLLGAVFSRWMAHNDSGQAAALAYYALFALAPILMIAIAVAGLVLGRQIVQGQLMEQIQSLIGPRGAGAVRAMLEGVMQPGASIAATAGGLIALLFGATGVFAQLQYGLNQVWEVRPNPAMSWTQIIFQRFEFVLMMVGIGFLLLVSLVVSAVLNAVGHYLGGDVGLWAWVNFFASLAIVSVLFALIFKLLPDVHLAWSDVASGAVITALLFTAGKTLIGLYLGRTSVSSAYGAAGSVVIVMIWVYYSAQLVFIGAEFTAVWALRHGSLVKPKRGAEPLADAA